MPLSDRQARARAAAVGASEVGCLVGDYLHPYASPASVYGRIVLGYQRTVGSAADLGPLPESNMVEYIVTENQPLREITLGGTDHRPDLDAIWAANEGGTAGAVIAVKNAGKAGKVAVFGTDMSEQLARFLLEEVPADPDRQRIILEAVAAFDRDHLTPRVPPVVELERDEDLVLLGVLAILLAGSVGGPA
jgi:hypothetical protein